MFVCEGVWVLEKQRSRFQRLSWQRLVFPDLHQPNLLWNTVRQASPNSPSSTVELFKCKSRRRLLFWAILFILLVWNLIHSPESGLHQHSSDLPAELGWISVKLDV